MILEALHLDEGEAGFSSTRADWFRVTRPAPNEARIGLSRPLIVYSAIQCFCWKGNDASLMVMIDAPSRRMVE